MKNNLRSLVLCTAVLLMTLGASVSSNSLVARPQHRLDPVCVRACQQILSECFANAPSPADQKKCFAAYRHCIAHCN